MFLERNPNITNHLTHLGFRHFVLERRHPFVFDPVDHRLYIFIVAEFLSAVVDEIVRFHFSAVHDRGSAFTGFFVAISAVLVI